MQAGAGGSDGREQSWDTDPSCMGTSLMTDGALEGLGTG